MLMDDEGEVGGNEAVTYGTPDRYWPQRVPHAFMNWRSAPTRRLETIRSDLRSKSDQGLEVRIGLNRLNPIETYKAQFVPMAGQQQQHLRRAQIPMKPGRL